MNMVTMLVVPEGARQQPSVLLVEDDSLVAASLKRLLTALDFEVLETRSAADAMAALQSGETPACVWSDLDLGEEIDGVDVLIAAARLRPMPALLLVTACPGCARAAECPAEALVFAKERARDAALAAAAAVLLRRKAGRPAD